MGAPSSRTFEILHLDEGRSRKILKSGDVDGGVGKRGERVTGLLVSEIRSLEVGLYVTL